MKKSKQKFNEAELAAITSIQQTTGVSRKTAIKKLRKDPDHYLVKNTKAAVAPAPAKPEPTRIMKAATPKPASKPSTDAGKARSAGVQLFILAGRPSKADFVKVYGPKGPALTWDARAALGVDAANFQKALKSGKCVAPVQG